MSVVGITGRLYGQFRTNMDENGETQEGKTAFIQFDVGEYNFRKKQVVFFPCVAFGKTASVVQRFWVDGRSVTVEGSLDQDKFTTNDGREVRKTVVIGHKVIFATDGENGSTREKAEPKSEEIKEPLVDDDGLPF